MPGCGGHIDLLLLGFAGPCAEWHQLFHWQKRCASRLHICSQEGVVFSVCLCFCPCVVWSTVIATWEYYLFSLFFVYLFVNYF